MPLKAVLLDWGGVISPGGTPDELVNRLTKNLAVQPDALRAALKTQTDPFKRGKLTLDEFWAGLEQALGHTIPESDRDVWTKIGDLAPDTSIIDFVGRLKAKGFVVAILSNTFPNTADDIKSQGWYDLYSPVVLSSDVGMAKPDAAIYDHVVSLLGVRPQEVVFVDDQQKCLDPAAAMGMRTILAQDPAQVIGDLSDLLGLTE